MKTILLTGATGYLGSRLGRRFLQEGYELIAIYHNSQSFFEFEDKYAPQVHKVYLSDNSLKDVFSQYHIDIIVHTATLYGRKNEDISDIIAANVIFPAELMSLACEYKVDTFINTDTILNKYINSYSLTKSHVTDWMKMFADEIKMIDIKLDHFYGPDDNKVKFVALMLEKLRNNESEIELTEGTQTRDFIYIDDVVDAYMTILQHLDKFSKGNIAVFEVGTNQKTSIRYLVSKLKELTHSSSQLKFGAIPYRKNEVLDYDVNTTALRLLGWKPKVSIDDGLKRICYK